MKKLILLLFILPLSLQALELGTNFRIGNLSLKSIDNSTVTTIDGSDYSDWGLDLFMTHQIADNLSIEAAYFNDQILKNIAYTLFIYKQDMLKLGVGPFFGLFNADLNTILKSGISTSIKLELTGVLFLDFRTDSSLAGRLVIDGDYIQERTDVTFGFYVQNAICTLNLFSKKFTQLEGSYEIIDGLTEFSFNTNIFQKNVPYKLNIDFAYQILSRDYIGATDAEYSLNSLIVGTGFDLDLTEAIQLHLNMENSVYSFGMGKLAGVTNPGPGGYAFRGTAGVTIDLDKLNAKEEPLAGISDFETE